MNLNRPHLWIAAALVGVPLLASGDSHPLAPADTSSPRETLRSFVTAVDKGLEIELETSLSYLASGRLYPNEREQRLRTEADNTFARALGTLDLSGLPSGFREVLAVEQVILLSEILSRLDLPNFEAIPDRETMKALGEKRWTLPNTQIEIGLIEEGPRQGEYLFSARTVANLGQFHDRVAALPYRPGALQRFVEAARPHTAATTLYDIYRNQSSSLGIVPGRWMLNMPAWLTARIIGVAVWQWLVLATYLLIGVLFAWWLRLVCRKTGSSPQWRWFATAAVVAVFARLMLPVCGQFHISGGVLLVTGTVSVAVLYLAAAGVAFIGAGAIAETIVRVQKRRVGAIDSQLTRLSAQLIGLVIGIALLIEGADELGFPAYSVLTGLGIGGLAIAFAARETLANLLGSIVIMLEKPFRSGHWVRVGEAEGTVEYVGFRSTQIRTFGDSLVFIPNSDVANAVIDNFGVRGRRRQRFFVQVTYSTPPEKVEAFVDRIRRIINDHPLTDKDVSYIHFNNFGESGLDILLYFYLRVPDFATELREREIVLTRILELAKEIGVEFAFPTRTLHVEDACGLPGSTGYRGPATSSNGS